uniref:Threonylcarbamoyl-AMP synthase n=1 Tax=Parasteatoda tepidariorum TaxID=114398 RepID=A0A2L2Y8T4_PARTP
MFAIRNKMTQIVKLMSNGCSMNEIVKTAAVALKEGKIIAVPTDTIYGIAVLSQNDSAVSSMYDIKGRHCEKPVSICVGSIEDIPKWGKITFPEGLLHDLLPGPVTIVMERTPNLNPNLNPDWPTIGIRIPKCKFIQDLASSCIEPLALTSANISSSSSSLSIKEFKELWPSLDLIVDGGILGQVDPKRLGSTIIDLSVKGHFKVWRSGCSHENTINILQKYGLTEIISS